MHITVDLETVSSTADVHALLQEALPLPEYYGHNLDALYDVLTDSHARWHIVFQHSAAAQAVLGEYMQSLKDTFSDAEEEGANVHAVWE